MNSGPNKTAALIFWASTLPLILAACFFYYPYAFTGPVICPMALVLGVPCPGCGLTRAFALALHGHLGEALAFHPLWPFVLLYLAFLWIYQLIETAQGQPPRLPTSQISAAAGLILVGFWFVRLGFFFAQAGLSTVAHDNLFARLGRVLR